MRKCSKHLKTCNSGSLKSIPQKTFFLIIIRIYINFTTILFSTMKKVVYKHYLNKIYYIFFKDEFTNITNVTIFAFILRILVSNGSIVAINHYLLNLK